MMCMLSIHKFFCQFSHKLFFIIFDIHKFVDVGSRSHISNKVRVLLKRWRKLFVKSLSGRKDTYSSSHHTQKGGRFSLKHVLHCWLQSQFIWTQLKIVNFSNLHLYVSSHQGWDDISSKNRLIFHKLYPLLDHQIQVELGHTLVTTFFRLSSLHYFSINTA